MLPHISDSLWYSEIESKTLLTHKSCIIERIWQLFFELSNDPSVKGEKMHIKGSMSALYCNNTTAKMLRLVSILFFPKLIFWLSAWNLNFLYNSHYTQVETFSYSVTDKIWKVHLYYIAFLIKNMTWTLENTQY